MKNRILKQTHDIKLAESLSPITKNLDEIKKTTEGLGDVIKENNTPQLAIENTPTNQPIINNERAIYDVEIENTLTNKIKQKGFFNIEERDNGYVIWNGLLVEKKGR